MCHYVGKYTGSILAWKTWCPYVSTSAFPAPTYLSASICIQTNTLIGQALLTDHTWWDCRALARMDGSPFMQTSNKLAPLLLNVNQVADLLGCHRNTIWNRVNDGQIPKPKKFGGKTVWQRTDIEKFVEALCN